MKPPAPSTLELFLSYASTGSEAVLLLKLFFTQMSNTYRWFTVYLALAVAQFMLLLPLPVNHNAYGWVWIFTEAPLAIVQVLIILELYKLVLGGYPGIASLGRWTFLVAVSIALTVTILTLLPDLSNASERYRVLLYISVARRAIYSSAAIFLLLITAFLAWYPIPLNRNIVIFALIYAPFFLGNAAALFARNIAGDSAIRLVSTILLAINVACILAWLAFLNPRGEERKAVAGHRWKPGDDERLIAQLDSVNRALLRAARK